VSGRVWCGWGVGLVLGGPGSFISYLDLPIEVDDGIRREQRHVFEAPAHAWWCWFCLSALAACCVRVGGVGETGDSEGRALPF